MAEVRRRFKLTPRLDGELLLRHQPANPSATDLLALVGSTGFEPTRAIHMTIRLQVCHHPLREYCLLLGMQALRPCEPVIVSTG